MKHKTEGTQRKTSPPNRCRLRPYCIPTPLTPQPPRRKADQIGRNLFERHHGSRNGLYDLKSMHPSLSLSVQFEKKDTIKKNHKNTICEKMETKSVLVWRFSFFTRHFFGEKKFFVVLFESLFRLMCNQILSAKTVARFLTEKLLVGRESHGRRNRFYCT